MTTPVWQEHAPPGWRLGRLKDLVDSCRNGAWGDEPPDESKIGTPTVRVADFDWAQLRVRLPVPTRRLVDPRILQRVGLDNGDLVLEKSGGGENQPVGRAVRFEGIRPAVCSNFTARLRPSRNAESRFLCYSLAAAYWGGINQKSIKQTTGIQNLDSKSYLSEAWSYPNLETQTAIADFLDRETERIDRLVEKKRRLIELLDEKRTALISHTVSKGLDPTVPMRDSSIAWLGDIPEHWETLRMSAFARLGGKTFIDGDWVELPYITDEGIRLIQTGNIGVGEYREQGFRYIADESFYELQCTEVMPGDVLVCRLADPVGRACLAPDLGVRMITSVDVCIVKTRGEVDARYLVYLLSSKQYLAHLDAIGRGGTRVRVSRSQLGQVRLPFPPLRDQERIASHLDDRVTGVSRAVHKIEKQLDKLAEYRQALITVAVTGHLDVNAEAPEPDEVVA